ncbi:hypothetical protein [Burkholderia sp. S171]|uniref:hypothetical protein n=1 Tax=Burkholderia sp. S171 TaxID=1641860 RepID=UPI00131BFFFB|nr:hypothetical protein [Burkholderia sp. S171]
MSAITLICRKTPPSSTLKLLGVIAGVAVASLAVAVCYEQYRKRRAAHALAAMPVAGIILPYLDANSQALLASLSKRVPPATRTPSAGARHPHSNDLPDLSR